MKYHFGKILGLLLFIAAVAVFGLAVMFLWNEILPGIFGLPAINYWQAAGLLILARILFGGIGGGFSHRFAYRNPFRNRWHGMSEAERDLFIKRRHHDSCDWRHDHRFCGGNNTGNEGETQKE